MADPAADPAGAGRFAVYEQLGLCREYGIIIFGSFAAAGLAAGWGSGAGYDGSNAGNIGGARQDSRICNGGAGFNYGGGPAGISAPGAAQRQLQGAGSGAAKILAGAAVLAA